MANQKTYYCCEVTLEDFEASGMPCSVLSIGAEFSFAPGWPPEGFDPGEPCELELETVEVLSAWIGEGQREASVEEIALLQKALRNDWEARARVEAQLEAFVS